MTFTGRRRPSPAPSAAVPLSDERQKLAGDPGRAGDHPHGATKPCRPAELVLQAGLAHVTLPLAGAVAALARGQLHHQMVTMLAAILVDDADRDAMGAGFEVGR